MADYKAIKGWTIQTVSSDPSNLVTGQVWYNSTLGKIRGAKLAAGAWASGGNLNSARRTPGGTGNGTQGAFSIFGGTAPQVLTIQQSMNNMMALVGQKQPI